MYKSLMSELGVVMAPHPLSPADTLGYSGFQIAFEAGFTQISNNADFWKKGVRERLRRASCRRSRDGAQGHLAAAARLRDRRRRHQAHRQQHVRRAGLRQAGAARRLPRLADPVAGGARRRCRAWSARAADRSDHWSRSTPRCRSRSASAARSRSIPTSASRALMIFVRGQVIDTTPNVDAYKQGPSSIDLNANTIFPDPDTIVALARVRRLPPALLVLRVHRRVRLHVLQRHGDQLRPRRSDADRRPLGRPVADQLVRPFVF